MATAKLNNFTFQQLSQAVSQIFGADKFWTVNSHVPVADRARIRQNVIEHRQWPAFPLFSPYANTHDGYSQSKYRYLFDSIQG
jgi:glutaredoxin-related protein